ncbi:MAG: SH3 domain-containing protein [Chloroflexi bacterium]|nr:SH3 domain-containing protein [Chloroflexota bacterium]
MSVQKMPNQRGGVDDNAINWEEDLKPFTRLPRAPRNTPRQRVPALIPGLISLVIVVVACGIAAKFISDNRPALSNITIAPTATFAVIIPTATEFVPPTATPYVAPTDVPPPTAAAQAETTNDPISVGAMVKIVDTGPNGLNFRKEPSRNAEKLRTLPEGNVYEVIGGPQEADSLVWWQLKDPSDGIAGWGAADYMRVVPQ